MYGFIKSLRHAVYGEISGDIVTRHVPIHPRRFEQDWITPSYSFSVANNNDVQAFVKVGAAYNRLLTKIFLVLKKEKVYTFFFLYP